MLPHTQIVVATNEDVADVLDFDSLFEFGFHLEFELIVLVSVSPADGTAGLVVLEILTAANVDRPILCIGTWNRWTSALSSWS